MLQVHSKSHSANRDFFMYQKNRFELCEFVRASYILHGVLTRNFVVKIYIDLYQVVKNHL
jgi:hypothetical protein